MNRFGRLAQLLGLNSIPLAGIFFGEWSDSTAIAFYWCETALVVFFVSLRLVLHRRLTNKRGHYVGSSRGVATYNQKFLLIAIGFGIGNLIFLAVILGFFSDRVGGGPLDFQLLKEGLLVATVLVGLGFAIDVLGISERPFVWVRLQAEAAHWRVFVIYLSIFIGLFCAMVLDLPHTMFSVFFGLKLFSDVASNFKQYDPDRPPRWLKRVIKDPAFEEGWHTERQTRRKAEVKDEEPFDGQPSTFKPPGSS